MLPVRGRGTVVSPVMPREGHAMAFHRRGRTPGRRDGAWGHMPASHPRKLRKKCGKGRRQGVGNVAAPGARRQAPGTSA